jgi:hypothetical protein
LDSFEEVSNRSYISPSLTITADNITFDVNCSYVFCSPINNDDDDDDDDDDEDDKLVERFLLEEPT